MGNPQVVSNSSLQQRVVEYPTGKKTLLGFRASERLPVVSAVWAWRLEDLTAQVGPCHDGRLSLFTQMLAEGTQRRVAADFKRVFENEAASFSAFVSRDTVGLRMDCLSDAWDTLLPYVYEALLEPAWDAGEWERVRREHGQALQAQKDHPSARLSLLLQPLLFGTGPKVHPYACPLQGTLESVPSLIAEMLPPLHSALLQIPTAYLGVAGHLPSTVEDFLQGWRDTWGVVPCGEGAVKPSEPTLPRESQVAFEELEREQTHLVVSFRTGSVHHPRRLAWDLAAALLSGQSGRLFMDLREEQSLAYSVGAWHSPMAQGGHFALSMATAGKKFSQAWEGLLRHVRLLCSAPPSEEELQKAKNTLIVQQASDLQHMHHVASRLAMGPLHGFPFDHYTRYKERVLAVSREEIMEAFQEALRLSPPQLAVVGEKDLPLPTQVIV